MSKEAVGKKLLHYRSLRGLTQTGLADISGVGARTIQQIEYGKGGKRETLLKIAAALRIGIEQLDETAALPAAIEPGSPDPVLNQISKLTQQIEALRSQLGTTQGTPGRGRHSTGVYQYTPDTIISKSQPARSQSSQLQLSERELTLLREFRRVDEERKVTVETLLGLREYEPEPKPAQSQPVRKNKA